MIHNFDAPFVAWYPVNNHQQIKQTLLPKILSHSNKKENCFKRQFQTGLLSSATTSFYHQSLDYFTDDILNAIVWQPFDAMLEEKQYNVGPTHSDIIGLWWNVYERGDSASLHRHSSADFTGIYLLHNEEDNKTVFFHDEVGQPNFPKTNALYHTNHITEGYTILFPSHLLHYVEPCEKNRVIVSFNIATAGVAE